MQRKKSWKWKGIRIDFHCLRSWFLTKPISFITSWSRFSRYAWKKYKREWKKENPQLVAQHEQICCVTSCEFDEKQATKPKFVAQSRFALYFSQKISSTCNKCFLGRQVDHAWWKTRNIDQNLQRNNVARQVEGFCISYFAALLRVSLKISLPAEVQVV